MKHEPPSPSSNQERALVDYVRRLSRQPYGRQALEVLLSGLKPEHRQPQHLRIVTAILHPLADGHDGALFSLQNGDVVLIGHKVPAARLEEAIAKVRFLFSGDPLFSHAETPESYFLKIHDLEQGFDTFLARVQELARASLAAAQKRGPSLPEGASVIPDAGRLQAIAATIERADVTSLLRRQPVCVLDAGQRVSPLYADIVVDKQELFRALLPDVDLLANRWLYRQLSTHLDSRLLAVLARSESSIRHSFGVNFSLATLTSEAFLKYDSALPAKIRNSIVIELQLVEIIADLPTFHFTRDFLRERGYRICLDPCSHVALPLIDRRKLGFDFVKLNWSEDLATEAGPSKNMQLAIDAVGRERVILTRSDTEAAIVTGQALGLEIFQGREVSHRLSAQNASEKSIHQMADAMERHRHAMRQSGMHE